jgi:UDP-2,3-diacylglucosamine pyrophosphatase LpxH
MSKRAVKVAVISDVHLGFLGCKAKELNKYLKSIKPEILVINGDFVDIWQFRTYYFPKAHAKGDSTCFQAGSRWHKDLFAYRES